MTKICECGKIEGNNKSLHRNECKNFESQSCGKCKPNENCVCKEFKSKTIPLKPKLKTLEDFRPEGKFGGVDVEGQSIRITLWMLKQEAIKWYKYHLKQIKIIENKVEKFGITSSEQKQIMRMHSINGWLWNFFNITEEDLK